MDNIIDDYNRYYRLKSMREAYSENLKGIKDKNVRNKTLKEIERMDKELEDYDTDSLAKVKEFIKSKSSVTEAKRNISELGITSVRKAKEEIEYNFLEEDKLVVSKHNQSKLKEYFTEKKKFDSTCKNMKEIEEISINSKEEKSTLLSTEGREKEIDHNYKEEYTLLTNSKKKSREKIRKEYDNLKGENIVLKFFPDIDYYNSLSDEDKLKENNDILERIFSSSYLPNQGKKTLITYKCEKHYIPTKYIGVYREVVREINKLSSHKPSDKFDIYFQSESEKVKEKLYNEMFNEDKIKRQNELINELFGSKIKSLDFNEVVESSLYKPSIRSPQKVNKKKSFITNVSINIKNNLKKLIDNIIKPKGYKVVNRETNFKEDTCIKYDESKGKIGNFAKELIKEIKQPFIELRKECKRDIEKEQLEEKVKKLERENRMLSAEVEYLLEKRKNGYILTGVLTTFGFILIGISIFTIIGKFVIGG